MAVLNNLLKQYQTIRYSKSTAAHHGSSGSNEPFYKPLALISGKVDIRQVGEPKPLPFFVENRTEQLHPGCHPTHHIWFRYDNVCGPDEHPK